MKMIHLVIVVAVLVVALCPVAGAQNQVPHDAMGGGGGKSSQGSLWLHDTIGQPVLGFTTDASHMHASGYWRVIDALHIGPTSAVLISAFDATYHDGAVQLRWVIESADGLAGFHVYRGHAEAVGFVRLNEGILSADEEYGYRDERVRPSTTYWYRLGAIDDDGEFFSPVVKVRTPAARTTLYQNRPNPFNPSTEIVFYVPRETRAVLTIYDARGGVVRRLLDEEVTFGRTTVTWDGTNDQGEGVGSGVYFYRLRAGKDVRTRKLMILK